jgi:hypothetical protein
MAVRFSVGLKNKLLGENGVDSGADGLRGIMKDGVIEIRTGSQPATASGAVTGTLLAYITESGGTFTPGATGNGLEFGAPAAGVVAKATGETWKTNSAIASGTAGWGRFRGNAADAGSVSATLPRIDFSIAKTGGDVNMSNTTFASGAPNTIDVFQITMS